MVERSDCGDTTADRVTHWRHLFRNFSKHIQDGISAPDQAPWLLEVLQVVFGDKETIRRKHPWSFLLCPQSPLVIEGPRTDAYLELVGWDIPVAVMPMPLMGATGPGSLISTTVLGNCEVLAMLCLVQAGAPGMTTDQYAPGIQSAYERAMNGLLPALSGPDIFIGCGLMGGSMILSLEQLLIDVEVFRMCKRIRQGVASDQDKWLEDVIHRIGPGGNFLAECSTIEGIRGGELYISEFGWHDTMEAWDAAGRPELLTEAHEKVDQILASHEPLPLGEDVERELDRIQKRAQMECE